MVGVKRLTDYEKGRIDELRAAGKGYSEIARQLKRSEGAVRHYVTGYRNYGQTVSSGRPRKLSRRDERAIGRAASNSFKSAANIKRELDLDVSKNTVLRAIRRTPFIKRAKLLKVPKLTLKHKTRRVEFARANMSRDWSRVTPSLFSRLKKFEF